MKQFTMSLFLKKEHLYKAKAEYWQAVAERLLEDAVEQENLCHNKESDEYYYPATGERIDEGL